MLYRDLLDQRTLEPRQLAPRPDVAARVDGHGTGLSTGRPKSARPLALAFSVAGNTVVATLFLGGLYLAPFGLDRLLSLL